MIGGYVLGSDTETIIFEHGSAVSRPAGASHAVDLQHPPNRPGAAVGYALCGQPVRVWVDERFGPDARQAHDRCADAAHAGQNRPA